MYRTTIQSLSKKALAYSLAFTLVAFPVVNAAQALAAPAELQVLSLSVDHKGTRI